MRAGVLVVAKAPVAGEAKTRLAADVGGEVAADLAAAALLDTLDACEAAFGRGRRVLALTGALERGARGTEIQRRLRAWTVMSQRGSDFATRLATAHADAAAAIRGRVVQIGTDTPQVTPECLQDVVGRLSSGLHDAVVGPAVDGGWWALGLTEPGWARGLVDVPMSTSRTCLQTRRMLAARGVSVVDATSFRDVDTLLDAGVVALEAPGTRFAQAWSAAVSGRLPAAALFDAALAGAACVLHGLPAGPMDLPVAKWSAGCDTTDAALLDQCSGATLDVGCGPGRLTHGLSQRGLAALGIDIAPRAVRQTRRRGALALRRNVFEPLPAEGRWESVLLADGNIGIGGDPLRLLLRIHDLLAPTGRAVVEAAPVGTAASTHQVRLEVAGQLSFPFPWAVLGPEALCALARQAALRMLSVSEHGGRVFVQLERASSTRCGR